MAGNRRAGSIPAPGTGFSAAWAAEMAPGLTGGCYGIRNDSLSLVQWRMVLGVRSGRRVAGRAGACYAGEVLRDHRRRPGQALAEILMQEVRGMEDEVYYGSGSWTSGSYGWKAKVDTSQYRIALTIDHDGYVITLPLEVARARELRRMLDVALAELGEGGE